MIGDKDEVATANDCPRANWQDELEVVVYPGAAHAFAVPGLNSDFLGAPLVYDEKSAQDAQAQADVFIAAHMKCATGKT
jgi:dienelactone hydrolase